MGGVTRKIQEDLIAELRPIFKSAIGRNLIEATQNLLDDQECFSDDVVRFEY